MKLGNPVRDAVSTRRKITVKLVGRGLSVCRCVQDEIFFVQTKGNSQKYV